MNPATPTQQPRTLFDKKHTGYLGPTPTPGSEVQVRSGDYGRIGDSGKKTPVRPP